MPNKKITYITLIVVVVGLIFSWFVYGKNSENRARMKARQADMAEHNPQLLERLISANEKLEQILKDNPKDAQSWFELGSNKSSLGDYTGAIKALKKNVELDRISLTGLNNLGLIYQELKEYDKAEAAFIEMTKREKDLTDGYLLLADLYQLTGQKDKETAARQKIDEIIKARP